MNGLILCVSNRNSQLIVCLFIEEIIFTQFFFNITSSFTGDLNVPSNTLWVYASFLCYFQS